MEDRPREHDRDDRHTDLVALLVVGSVDEDLIENLVETCSNASCQYYHRIDIMLFASPSGSRGAGKGRLYLVRGEDSGNACME